MEDKKENLVYFSCVLLAVAGILLIHFTAEEPLKTNSLSSELIGKKVRLSGTVNSKWVHEGHVFLSVNDEKVVVFKKDAQETSLNPYYLLKGDPVHAIGKVKRYEGELEVVADELRWGN